MSENNTAIVQNLDVVDINKAIEDLHNPETIFAQDDEEDELDDLDEMDYLNDDEFDAPFDNPDEISY